MRKRRDPNRPPGTPDADAPPEQSAVERAIRSVLDRLKPKALPDKRKPDGKTRRTASA